MKRGTELFLVRFIMKNAPYNVGEQAGFPEDIAKRFVEAKPPRAVYVELPSEEAEPVPPKTETGSKAEKPKEKVVDETLIVPEKVGGPFYMVAGEKILGMANAQERADILNAIAKD